MVNFVYCLCRTQHQTQPTPTYNIRSSHLKHAPHGSALYSPRFLRRIAPSAQHTRVSDVIIHTGIFIITSWVSASFIHSSTRPAASGEATASPSGERQNREFPDVKPSSPNERAFQAAFFSFLNSFVPHIAKLFVLVVFDRLPSVKSSEIAGLDSIN